jgi:hypothetical protein
MNQFIAFILPLATAMVGMRLGQWILGKKFAEEYGSGFRFAFGLGMGMLVFSQAVLLSALAGLNVFALLAWVALVWGIVEMVLRTRKAPAVLKSFKFQTGHYWLLLLLPLFYSWWVFGRLSTLEGTLEFDANAFWVFKAKILFLAQGKALMDAIHQPNLGYTHMDYPMLVPCLYTLGYGSAGQVDEFINKVWPFWMMVALSLGILSFARVWRQPRVLPIAVVTLIGFLPATLQFIRNEGGTIPMVFYTSLATMLIINALRGENELAPAAVILALTGCFSTKFEGVVFAAICSAALLPFCFRRGWLKNKTVWKSAVVAVLCVLPYVIFRLSKPISHPEDAWLHLGTMPGSHGLLHRFSQIWFLNVFARFFDAKFFSWQDVNDRLQFTGHWGGLGSLANEQLSILPWLLMALIVITLIFKSRERLTVGVFSGIIIVIFSILSFVIACLRVDDLPGGIDFTIGVVGRYFYPLFVAWFLAIVALWLPDKSTMATADGEAKANPAGPLVPKQKRQR